MKKGIILLTALIFTACVNLEDIVGNSGGEIKEIKTTDTNIKKSVHNFCTDLLFLKYLSYFMFF